MLPARAQTNGTTFDDGGRPHVRGASMVKLQQWEEWLAYWVGDLSDAETNEVRFLRDATMRWHGAALRCARLLRNTEDDPMSIADTCLQHLAWFRAQRPRDEHLSRDGRLFAQAIEGGFANMVRLAKELAEVRETRGILTLSVNAAGEEQ